MLISVLNAPSLELLEISTPPIGMGIFSGHLYRNQIEFEQDDLYIEIVKNKRLFKKWKDKPLNSRFAKDITKLAKVNGDIVCISITSDRQFLPALAIAEHLQQKGKEVFLGGNFFSVVKIDDLKKDFPKIPTILEKQEDFFEILKERGVIKDYNLNSLSPYFDKKVMHMYQRTISGKKKNVIPYLVHMGCNKGCAYCISKLYSHDKGTDVPKKIEDIQELKAKFNSNLFFFCDCAINNFPSILDEFIDRLPPLHIKWGAFLNPYQMTRVKIKKMAEAGCKYILMGIESGSTKVLKLMRRAPSPKMATDTLRWAKEFGIFTYVYFIVNFPGETEEDFKATKEFVRRNKKIIDDGTVSIFHLHENSTISHSPDQFDVSLGKKYNYVYFTYSHKGQSWKSIKAKGKKREAELNRTFLFNVKFKKYLSHPLSSIKRLIGWALLSDPYCVDNYFDLVK